MSVYLVPKLLLGNPDGEAPASRDRKLELPAPNSRAGAWELAQDFGLVFDHDASDVNIKYLARVETDHRIVAERQKTPVDRQGFNHIGIINLFQRGADAPRLTSGFFAGPLFITFSAIAKTI